MVYSNTIATEVAAHLLDVGAVQLRPTEPFTWSSGWKSPIYCDNRISLSDPAIRSSIKVYLAQMIEDKFGPVDAIAGVATAGIAQGVLVADYLQLPFCYVRPKPKEHGMGKQIEGAVQPGQRIAMVEDLISTGGSSLQAVKPLEEHGCEVKGIAAIFNYGFSHADENFKAAGVAFATLSNYDALLPIALERGIISQDQLALLKNWRLNPAEWGK